MDKIVSVELKPTANSSAKGMLQPSDAVQQGIRSTLLGMAANALLAAVKLIAGVLGNAYALIADAVESMGDIISSLIVLAGLRISRREPDDVYPYGYGRAETLAAAAVSLIMMGTAIGIAWAAIVEIQTPRRAPAAWTLIVLVVVIIVKGAVSRMVNSAGAEIGSRSVKADAWHHLADAITSAAAFVGIAIAVYCGPGWETAEDWAALLASAIIFLNGSFSLLGAIHDLMDRKLEPELYAAVRRTAESVPGVCAIEKLGLRRTGLRVFADIHVQADPSTPLIDAHAIGGRVKVAIRQAHPVVVHVLVHMEPYEESSDHAVQ